MQIYDHSLLQYDVLDKNLRKKCKIFTHFTKAFLNPVISLL